MKLHRRNLSFLAAATLAVLPGIGSSTSASIGNGLPPSWLPAPLRLAGVWDVNVTLRDCTSGNAMVTFPAMNQYGADGSSIEFGVNMPPSLRYPSLGTWRFSGQRSYSSQFSFFRFNPDGSYAGTQDVKRSITLSNDANQFTSVASVSIYDPQHHLVKSGCATEAGVRR